MLEPVPDWLSTQSSIVHLRHRLDRGGVVPFVGAGISMALGYPSWRQLVERLREQVPAPSNTSISRQGIPSDPQIAVDYLRLVLGEEGYFNALRATFDLDENRKSQIQTSPLFAALQKLPCLVWLTTNYDLALEYALRRPRVGVNSHSWSDEAEINRFILGRESRTKRPAVFHLHGKLDVERDIVLTERDYQQRYWWIAGDRFRLATLLSTRTALFLGTSLTDEDLKSVLREVRARLRQKWGQHFWVRGVRSGTVEWTDAAWRQEQSIFWREKFGVEIVYYPVTASDAPSKEDHSALVTVLSTLERDAPQLQYPRTTTSDAADQDPNKGAFGGLPEVDGYRLRASFRPFEQSHDLLRVLLSVDTPDDGPKAESVTWFLHPTFDRDQVQTTPLRNGKARLELVAWGAFTVGVQVEVPGRPALKLELDLALASKAPKWFRDR
jgi:hypothetical protein